MGLTLALVYSAPERDSVSDFPLQPASEILSLVENNLKTKSRGSVRSRRQFQDWRELLLVQDLYL